MRNFPMQLWRVMTQHQNAVACVTPSGSVTFGEMTRHWHRLAVGLMERGFEPETRVALMARNSYEWLVVAGAVWLAGGCVTPLVPGLERREALRCMARSGCEWIVVTDIKELDALRGQGANLPAHLRWLVIEEQGVGQLGGVATYAQLMEQGRHRELRGGDKLLAERMYKVSLQQPTVIMFEPKPGDDPRGSFFGGERLAAGLEALSEDLRVTGQEERLASVMSLGWFHAFWMALALLWRGGTLLLASGSGGLAEQLAGLRPTRLLAPPSYVESLARHWRAQLEQAPEFLKRIADDPASAAAPAGGGGLTGLTRVLGFVGDRAAERVLYEPLRKRMGDALHTIWMVGEAVPQEVEDLFARAKVDVLSVHGYPEAGITHMERPGSQRHGSVGRPVYSCVCKIDGAREGEVGEVCVKSPYLFNGYWDQAGPRALEDGWLRTGDRGRIVEGFLVLGE